MSEAATISRTTSVKLQFAALFGGASFLILATWGVATYSTNITTNLEALKTGQAQLSAAQLELSQRFESLRSADDLRNWKVSDQEAWTKVMAVLNPELKLPEVPHR